MKNLRIYFPLLLSILLVACSSDDDSTTTPSTPSATVDFSGTYAQEDQMGRPAVNTVFVGATDKNKFNTTVPSLQDAAFQSMFETNLMALSPAYTNMGDQNALMQDAATFSGLLATDVLNVSLDGKTTFFDGVNVLTGRALADDAISVELLLIFGGEDGMENSGLSDDHVDANDKTFLTQFPYLATPW